MKTFCLMVILLLPAHISAETVFIDKDLNKYKNQVPSENAVNEIETKRNAAFEQESKEKKYWCSRAKDLKNRVLAAEKAYETALVGSVTAHYSSYSGPIQTTHVDKSGNIIGATSGTSSGTSESKSYNFKEAYAAEANLKDAETELAAFKNEAREKAIPYEWLDCK